MLTSTLVRTWRRLVKRTPNTGRQTSRSRRLGCEALEDRNLRSVAGPSLSFLGPVPQLSVNSATQNVSSYGYLYYGSNNTTYVNLNTSNANSSGATNSLPLNQTYNNTYYAYDTVSSNASQTLGPNTLNISTSASAYGKALVYGNYTYSSAYASESVGFNLSGAATLTFSYSTSAYASTVGGEYSDAYGQGTKFTNSAGMRIGTPVTEASSAGGGQYSNAAPGSFSVTLPAGNYTLYCNSYDYVQGPTNAIGYAASSYSISLTGISRPTGTFAAFAAVGGTSTPAAATASGALSAGIHTQVVAPGQPAAAGVTLAGPAVLALPPTTQPAAPAPSPLAATAHLDALFSDPGFTGTVNLTPKALRPSGASSLGSDLS